MSRCFVPLAWVLASVGTAKKSTPPCLMDNVTYVDASVTGALPNGAFVVSAKDCQNTCAASPSCASFTFKERGSPAGVVPVVPSGGCYLFGAAKPSDPEAGATSGPKRCKGQKKRFRLPFNVTFPAKWFPEGHAQTKAAKKPKEAGPSVTEDMKARFKALGHKVSNLDVCGGPRCCAGSTCHMGNPCDGRRGKTTCIGAGMIPFKWGQCQCVSGACSSVDGLCSDAPGQPQQKFEAPGAEATSDVADERQRNREVPSAALLGATSVLLVGGLAAGVRSVRRGGEVPQQATLREHLECELVE